MRKGSHHTAEALIKIGNTSRGRKPTPETCAKLKARANDPAVRAKRYTPERNEKIKRTKKLKPYRHSDEIKKKLSEMQIGRTYSKETRKKFSDARKRYLSTMTAEERSEKIGKHHRGEKNWNWKGGTSKFDKQLRTTVAYKEWRKQIFERDNWTCQDCGKDGIYVYAHHIISFAEMIEAFSIIKNKFVAVEMALNYEPLWNIDNGITLCLKCHWKKHKKRGKK